MSVNVKLWFISDLGTVTDDTHSDKIEEIRETIRRKRCIEKGEEYIPPDEVNTESLDL